MFRKSQGKYIFSAILCLSRKPVGIGLCVSNPGRSGSAVLREAPTHFCATHASGVSGHDCEPSVSTYHHH